MLEPSTCLVHGGAGPYLINKTFLSSIWKFCNKSLNAAELRTVKRETNVVRFILLVVQINDLKVRTWFDGIQNYGVEYNARIYIHLLSKRQGLLYGMEDRLHLLMTDTDTRQAKFSKNFAKNIDGCTKGRDLPSCRNAVAGDGHINTRDQVCSDHVTNKKCDSWQSRHKDLITSVVA